MAGAMRLTDGGTTIDFSPILGYVAPYARREAVNVTLSGKRFTHTWNQKERHDIPIVNVSAANKATYYIWWNAKTELTYTPDLDGAPGTTITVKMLSSDFPLQLFNLASFDTYAGTLVLVEV